MRYGSTYCTRIWPDKRDVAACNPLNEKQSNRLREKILLDAKGAYYSSFITLADVFRAIEQRFYTWSVVKLYYLSSFMLRAYLELDGYVLFHIKTTPYYCRALPGEHPKRPPGSKKAGGANTHKIAFNLFDYFYSSHFLVSQPIGIERPYEWLISQREHFNYKIYKCVEPAPPQCFSKIKEIGERRLLEAYFQDDDLFYTFDPDHAMLAYPVTAMKEVRKHFNRHSVSPLDQEEIAQITSYWRDRYGPLRFIKEQLT